MCSSNYPGFLGEKKICLDFFKAGALKTKLPLRANPQWNDFQQNNALSFLLTGFSFFMSFCLLTSTLLFFTLQESKQLTNLFSRQVNTFLYFLVFYFEGSLQGKVGHEARWPGGDSSSCSKLYVH